MLILIAGITGFVGIPCARSAFSRGHKVRGLARNIDNLPQDVRDRLEGFETMISPYDIAAMDRATKGVDAIICSFAAVPEMYMESQMLLIRAAERAGVKVRHTVFVYSQLTKTLLRFSTPHLGIMTGPFHLARMRFMTICEASLTTWRSAQP